MYQLKQYTSFKRILYFILWTVLIISDIRVKTKVERTVDCLSKLAFSVLSHELIFIIYPTQCRGVLGESWGHRNIGILGFFTQSLVWCGPGFVIINGPVLAMNFICFHVPLLSFYNDSVQCCCTWYKQGYLMLERKK